MTLSISFLSFWEQSVKALRHVLQYPWMQFDLLRALKLVGTEMLADISLVVIIYFEAGDQYVLCPSWTNSPLVFLHLIYVVLQAVNSSRLSRIRSCPNMGKMCVYQEQGYYVLSS